MKSTRFPSMIRVDKGKKGQSGEKYFSDRNAAYMRAPR